jgi:RNA polymerase sigma factor for flagellar operon FliA
VNAAAPLQPTGVDHALVEAHTSLARRIAAALYANRHVATHAFEDFHQFALLGLVEAAQRFDASLGVPFEAYAAPRVRGAVLNGVRSLTEQQEQIALRARLARQRTESLRAGRDAEPLASEPDDLFADLVTQTVGLAIGHLLQDSGMYCDGEGAAPEAGYQRFELRQLSQRVIQCLQLLPEREGRLLRGHYLNGEPLETIAAQFAVTKGRVSQLHRQAIERLRVLCAEHGLRGIRL